VVLGQPKIISAKIKMRQPLEWLQPVCARISAAHEAKLFSQATFQMALGSIWGSGWSGKTRYRGSGSFILASAYPITAIAAAFSRNSAGTILSSVSAAV